MVLLPVLDVMDGKVMHAYGGCRDAYLPLTGFSSCDPSPLPIIEKLSELYPFQQLYIADLNAIRSYGNNHSLIATVAQRYPALSLWVDAGAATPKAVECLLEKGVTRPVIGTETLPDLEAWQALRNSPWAARLVLSLDYREGEFLGPVELEREPELWPATIIVMSLEQIGGKRGPHWPLLMQVKQKSLPLHRELFAAGGVRGLEDLKRLAAAGIKGVLLASALYDGSLGTPELQQVL